MRGVVLAVGLLLSACTDPGETWVAYVDLLNATGGMRTDHDPPDAPFDADDLALDFERTAFFVEADPLQLGRDPDATDKEGPLIRWADPVVISTLSLGSGGEARRAQVRRFSRRLAELSGLTITEAKPDSERARDDPGSNFFVIFAPADISPLLAAFALEEVGEDEDTVEHLRSIAAFARDWQGSESPCAGRLYSAKEDSGEVEAGLIVAAIVLIRDYLPDALTATCIEEELTQSLGLIGDHPDARPSLFNDDQEFARLTLHDELLLRILYDARLTPGMARETAMPIVREIARELRPASAPSRLAGDAARPVAVPALVRASAERPTAAPSPATGGAARPEPETARATVRSGGPEWIPPAGKAPKKRAQSGKTQP